ncbi:hypothetical protein RI129_012805 [Pyrocoelia pectoralis]|uniref:Uncharacterized protein n=1 Tax=Pyrocoelia pectoralis TaxID=417401 RepID=A0AAN7Z6T0_9COLE
MAVGSWNVLKGDVLPFDQKYHNMKLHNYSTIGIESVSSRINDEEFYLKIMCNGSTMYVDGNYEYPNAILNGVNLTSKGIIEYVYCIPEYNIPSMNPIRIPEWVVKRGEVLTFDQVYTNVELHNYSYVTIKEVRSKINDKEIYLHLKCLGPSTMEVKCDYRYDNAVLEGVDVSSTGIMDYTYYEHEFDVNFFGEIRKNGNDDYMFIRKVEVNMTNIESFHIKYTSENTAASAILTKKIGDIMDVLFSTNVGGYSDMYAAGKLQICKRSDPQIDDCMKSSIEKALKIFANGSSDNNMLSIDPLEIDAWVVPSIGAHVPYDQKYSNMKVYGYSDITIDELYASVDDQDFSLHMMCSIPKLTVLCDYEYPNAIINGEDLSSAGKAEYSYDAHKFYVKFDGNVIKKGNEEYLEIIHTDVATLRLHLFIIKLKTENADIEKKMNDFINNNSRRISNMNMGGYEKMYAYGFQRFANSIFSAIPYNKILPK